MKSAKSPAKPSPFAALESKLQEMQKSATQLETFLEGIKGAPGFDQEDEQFIRSKLGGVVEARDGLQQTLDQKRSIYDNQVRKFEEQLSLRQRRLESMDIPFPDVLAFFAKKQARLQESLGGIRTKLCE